MENERGYQILQQVPLIKAPFSAAPKPVKLSPEYVQLPTTIPETRLKKQDLESWIQECDTVKKDIDDYGKEDIENYNKWNDRVFRKLAPGYIGGSGATLLTPQKRNTTINNAATTTDNDNNNNNDNPTISQTNLQSVNDSLSSLNI